MSEDEKRENRLRLLGEFDDQKTEVATCKSGITVTGKHLRSFLRSWGPRPPPLSREK